MSSDKKVFSLEFTVDMSNGANTRVRGSGDENDLLTVWALGSVLLLDKIGMPVDKPLSLLGACAILQKAAEETRKGGVTIDVGELRELVGCD